MHYSGQLSCVFITRLSNEMSGYSLNFEIQAFMLIFNANAANHHFELLFIASVV
jgi:hypothetical protein